MKIFIASSGRSTLLAESLQSEITSASRRANLEVDVVTWFRDGAFPPGEDTLNALIAHCGGAANVTPADFCAVLLTKDDELTKKGDKGDAPRDNCIFELGLFIGALGLDPKRCFMLSSVGEQSLPSDLKGRTLITFDEPLDIHDPEQCRKAMERAAIRIRDRMRISGKYTAPELKPANLDDLMKLEALAEHDGALSAPGEVAVGVEHSFIDECQRTSQVVRNLMAGIQYTYFVSNVDPSNEIARLIRTLAATNLSRTGNIDDADKNLILQNLKLLQNGLSINLCPGQVPFGFRIHNASDLDRAICYARQPGRGKYYEWARERDAVELVRGLRSVALQDEDLDPVYVIRPTKFFDFQLPQNAHYLQRIRKAVAYYFHEDLRDEVERTCFGAVSKSQGASGS
jgi:hypothetical protein